MPTKTQALVLSKKNGTFRLKDVYIDDPQEDEVLVRIVSCGLCHTDLAVRSGFWDPPFPVVLGHEGAGIVEETGKAVKKLKAGDKVVLSFNSCTKCSACKKGHPAQCEHFDEMNLSWSRPDGSPTLLDAEGERLGGNFFGQSSLAYYAIANQANAVKVSTRDELASFAPLGCGMQAGAGTVMHELKPKPGSSLAVFGAGAVGLSAIMAAHILKVEPIIVIDKIPSRLTLAKKLGAHTTINTKKKSELKKLEKIDNIVETTGNIRLNRTARFALSENGKLSLLAIATYRENEMPPPLPGQTIFNSIAGDSNPQEFIPYLIESYKRDRFPFTQLIKHYTPDQINEAVQDSKKGKTIKPVIDF